jgi:cyclopropane fatty-acyl-phospholipid synthase-like methyltransferase
LYDIGSFFKLVELLMDRAILYGINAYQSEINKLGWYEEIPQPSLSLINKCNLDKDAVILDIGSGATTLIKHLIMERYCNVVALDISEVALVKARKRLRTDEVELINWIVDDITVYNHISRIGSIDLWHDRTVLHFLTQELQQKGYLESLKGLVKKGGYVIIGVFSLDGAKKCSGLDVKNYNHSMIAEFLGNDFELIDHFPYLYLMPSGDARPYIYTQFKRIKVT